MILLENHMIKLQEHLVLDIQEDQLSTGLQGKAIQRLTLLQNQTYQDWTIVSPDLRHHSSII